jgi:hypothetical protein
MSISPALKAAIVALPAGAWLLQAEPGVAATLALAAGAALVAAAWIVLARARRAVARHETQPLGRAVERPGVAEHQRILRSAVPGRMPRDVRCEASRATARARRSTRR